MFADEVFHEGDALGVVDDFELYALAADVFLGALEGFVFADDDAGDAIEQRSPAAHGTWRECGIEDALAIDTCGKATGVFEAVHLGVMDHAPLLLALVVATADDVSVVDKDGADGDATGGEPFPRLRNCRMHEWIGHAGNQ